MADEISCAATCERAWKAVRWLSAVDGLYVPPRIVVDVVADGAVLSQGEIGSYLSHLTAWRHVLENGLPAAIVLEDDAHLHPRFADIMRTGLDNIFAESSRLDWDVLALDLPLTGHTSIGDARLRDIAAEPCINVTRLALDQGARLVKLDAACAHVSIGGYVVSWRGANRLAAAALPARMPVDTFMLDLVQRAALDAFALLPASAHVEAYGTSDSVRRYFTVRDRQLQVTYQGSHDEPNCFRLPCRITLRE